MISAVRSTSLSRTIATAAATAVVASACLLATAAPASAAVWAVNSEATLISALADAATNGTGDDVISIEASFTMTGATLPSYVGSSNLTIDGGGHTITYVGTPGVMVIETSGAVLISDLTLGGTTTSGAAITVDAVSDVELSNVTVTSHLGPGPAASLTSDLSEVIIGDSSFSNAVNTAGSGGAVWALADQVSVLTSEFTSNGAYGDGGAVYADADGLDFIASTFDSNSAGGYGGAIHSVGNVEGAASFFDSNVAQEGGGAIFSDDWLDISFTEFTNNSTPGEGGAILASQNVTIQTSTFDLNVAHGDGGAVWAYEYADSFMSTFSNNTSDGAGGAIYSAGLDYSVQEVSTFTGNVADVGGAVYASGGDLLPTHSTFADNDADDGAAHLITETGEIHAYASSFSGATGSDGCFAGDSIVSDGYNFDQDGSCADEGDVTGDGGFGQDPKLGALADNGGYTNTRVPAVTSPLVDRVPLETCQLMADGGGSSITTDQRGVNRFDAIDLQGGGCDAGAIEVPKDITFVLAGEKGSVTFTVSGAFEVFDKCGTATSIASVGGTPPAGVSFPHGAFGFCADTKTPGGPVTVVADFPSPVNAAWKVADGTWTEIPGATFSNGGTRLTYSSRDGSILDADGGEDGVFEDPLAAGIKALGFAG